MKVVMYMLTIPPGQSTLIPFKAAGDHVRLFHPNVMHPMLIKKGAVRLDLSHDGVLTVSIEAIRDEGGEETQ